MLTWHLLGGQLGLHNFQAPFAFVIVLTCLYPVHHLYARL